MVPLNRLYRKHCDLYVLLKFKISFVPLGHLNNQISKFRIEGFEGNLILVRMIVKTVPRAYSGGLHVLLKYIFWLILAREREELESWFFGLAYLFDLYLLGSQYQMSTQTDMYWPLRDTECSFDKKIICIFMVSSPFSFQKSIPTWEICYFERKSTWNRSHRIMNCSTWTGIHFRLTFPIKIV